jgi:hypothetical protein
MSNANAVELSLLVRAKLIKEDILDDVVMCKFKINYSN